MINLVKQTDPATAGNHMDNQMQNNTIFLEIT